MLSFLKKIHINIIILTTYLLISSPAKAIENPGDQLTKVGINNKIGHELDLSLEFTDVNGIKKKLSDVIIPNKPILITPVYYNCPRLCGLFLSGFVKLLNNMDLKLGQDYQILTISFDPSEDHNLAKKRSDEYYARLSEAKGDKAAWHFMVGESANIDKLMSTIGFKYFEDRGEYAHTAAIIVLTPQGQISQYFTGIEFVPWDIRLGLIESSQGRVGSFADQVLLFCFRYDHAQGKYSLTAFNFIRLGGLLTLLALGVVIFKSTRRKTSTL